MAAPGRLFVVGSANMDLVVRAPRLPAPGVTVIGADLVRVPGGKGANQAVAAARLGTQVRFVGCVGADAFGADLRAALAADGVDVECLRSVEARPTGVALIVVDDRGENLIAVSPGANAALSVHDTEVALRGLTARDAVLAQLEVPIDSAIAALRIAHEVGAPTLLNAAPGDRAVLPYLGLVDTLIVNRGEAELLSGEADLAPAARTLRDTGAVTVVVTLGGDGLLLVEGDREQRLPAIGVDVVDTTAAGDAFAAAFAAARLEGRSNEAAARFANVEAALTTTRLGAQPSLPRRAEVDSVLTHTEGGT